MREPAVKRSLQLKQPDPAKEGVVRQDRMIPPAAQPSNLHRGWHKVTCPGMCCSLPALAASPSTLQLPRALTLSPLTPAPWAEGGADTASSRRDRLPGHAPPPLGEQVDEEERCREHKPREYCWGVSALVGVLFVCWFSQHSAESTMRAELQLQLMGPALDGARGAGEGGKQGGREAAGGTDYSSSGQGGAPSEPSSVGRTEGTGEEEEDEEEAGVVRRVHGNHSDPAGLFTVIPSLLANLPLVSLKECFPADCCWEAHLSCLKETFRQLSRCSPCSASSQLCPGHADNSRPTSTQELPSKKSRCGWGKSAGRTRSGRKGV